MRQAIGLYRTIGHRFGEVIALTNLGERLLPAGRLRAGRRLTRSRRSPCRGRLGSRRVEAWALTRLGAVSSRRGRYDQAVSSFQQALELFQEAADRDGEAEALNGSGETMLAVGQHDKARRFHLNALTLTRQTGGKREQARALTGLGAICYRQGQLDRAAGFHQDALALYREIGDPGGQAAALNGSGEVLLATGQPGEARPSSGRADPGPPDRRPLRAGPRPPRPGQRALPGSRQSARTVMMPVRACASPGLSGRLIEGDQPELRRIPLVTGVGQPQLAEVGQHLADRE